MAGRKGSIPYNKGVSGVYHHTPETRAKISAASKGRVASAETRAKLSEAKRGKKQPPGAIAKMVATRQADGSYKQSAETVEKRAAKVRGQKRSIHQNLRKSKSVRAKFFTREASQSSWAINWRKKSRFEAGLFEAFVSLGYPLTDEPLKVQRQAFISAARELGIPELRHNIDVQTANNWWRGKKHSDETRAKMSAAHRGRKQSPESISKRVAKLRGRKRTPEQRAAMSAARLGKKPNLTVEQRAAMSERARNTKRSPQAIEKGAAKLRGRPRPAATREAISRGHCAAGRQISSHARAEGLSPALVHGRRRRGKTEEAAIAMGPPNPAREREHNPASRYQKSIKAGLSPQTVDARRKAGWPESDWYVPVGARGYGPKPSGEHPW